MHGYAQQREKLSTTNGYFCEHQTKCLVSINFAFITRQVNVYSTLKQQQQQQQQSLFVVFPD